MYTDTVGGDAGSLRVGPKPRRVTKVVRCFDKLVYPDGWLPGQDRRVGWGRDGAFSPRGRSTKHQAHQQEGSPSRPSTPAAEPKLKLNHFTGPACLPSSIPPHPSSWNLFPLSRHLQPLNFPNLSIHPSTRPFFEPEKQSVKMGYTKTDELAINTIRVLAVSQLSSQAISSHSMRQRPAALPLHRRCRHRR